MLDCCVKILTISANEWNTVIELLHEHYLERDRTMESLRHKFLSLTQTTGSTNNQNCLPSVIRTKQIKRMIVEKIDGSSSGSKDDSKDSSSGNDGEDGRRGCQGQC